MTSDPPQGPIQIVRSSSRALRAVRAAKHVEWYVGLMLQTLPAIYYFVNWAPPFFPKEGIILAVIGSIVFMFSYDRERGRPRLPLRGFICVGLAVLGLILYDRMVEYTTVLPPRDDGGYRRQIGFYTWYLTDEANETINALANRDPQIKLQTPNDLMLAFGVWGGEAGTDKIWPVWTIEFAGVTLVGTFLSSFLSWSYGLGVLARYLSGKALTDDVMRALSSMRGHFRYDSGQHGDLWLFLDDFLTDVTRAQGWAAELGRQSRNHRPDIVCGPQTGGALFAQLLAAEIGADFVSAERLTSNNGAIEYRIPVLLRERLRGRRVLLVDDAVTAGHALLATLRDVSACGAEVVAFASLIVVGNAVVNVRKSYAVPFYSLASVDGKIWREEQCPLCEKGIPLTEPLSRMRPSD